MNKVQFFKVHRLPSRPEPNALYFVKASNSGEIDLFLTSKDRVPVHVHNSTKIQQQLQQNKELHIGPTAPSDTSKIWIDTSA